MLGQQSPGEGGNFAILETGRSWRRSLQAGHRYWASCTSSIGGAGSSAAGQSRGTRAWRQPWSEHVPPDRQGRPAADPSRLLPGAAVIHTRVSPGARAQPGSPSPARSYEAALGARGAGRASAPASERRYINPAPPARPARFAALRPWPLPTGAAPAVLPLLREPPSPQPELQAPPPPEPSSEA
ncbi:putative uncharacterized protein MGC34800 [Sphaerodactylus townsendi]|uniref:putative uncharacterized protein MGC34800 n=1 Tax=Sphaerodactylus townsendi TaxID=933632 RepID=UPI002026EF8A|nr:putative uncharacterized protein MGC34800 [Sphaerodactylus townsendi]